MLSLPLQRASVIDYLEDPRGDLTRGSTLLARIPANLTIFDASGRKLLRDRDSDAWILWRHIKALSGFGRTYTSKLLARKRPHLFPAYDSVIARALGIRGDGEHWEVMVDIFEDEARREHLKKLRERSDAPVQELSLLRIFDIVVWMEHRYLAG